MNHRIIACLFGMILFLGGCAERVSDLPAPYLETVVAKLEKIRSATYDSHVESWAPGDTVPALRGHRYYKAYSNPGDTALGASWVALSGKDTSRLIFAYDGHMRASVNQENKEIVVDSFTSRKLPFRPVGVPFYQYTQDLLTYALQTNDSVSWDIKDTEDTLYVKINIHADRQVEFFGKAHYIPGGPQGWLDPTSRYEIWIDKSTGLPYRYRREMEHNVSVETVENTRFNTLRLSDFSAASYFPADHEIKPYGAAKGWEGPHELLGKKAPDWALRDEAGETVALGSFGSSLVLVQFTSVNCGPCRASVPFLNRLATLYAADDLAVVAIESFTTNTNVLTTYRERTGLRCPFLMSEKETNRQYNIRATPVFYLLDADRNIRDVQRGYGGKDTEDKIIARIGELLKSAG